MVVRAQQHRALELGTGPAARIGQIYVASRADVEGEPREPAGGTRLEIEPPVATGEQGVPGSEPLICITQLTVQAAGAVDLHGGGAVVRHERPAARGRALPLDPR